MHGEKNAVRGGEAIALHKVKGDKREGGRDIEKGEVIEGSFPKWKSAIPTAEGREKATVEMRPLAEFLAAVKADMKAKRLKDADGEAVVTVRMPNGKEVRNVDYNPYIHIRPTLVNKQFKEAWARPNLVYVETEYPSGELTSGYRAEKAAKTVGMHKWGTQGEYFILSRWDKPVRIVPWERVADDWEQEFKGQGIPFDIIPPRLLPILAERGMEILSPHKGMGKACNDAYERWKSDCGQTSRRLFPGRFVFHHAGIGSRWREAAKGGGGLPSWSGKTLR